MSRRCDLHDAEPCVSFCTWSTARCPGLSRCPRHTLQAPSGEASGGATPASEAAAHSDVDRRCGEALDAWAGERGYQWVDVRRQGPHMAPGANSVVVLKYPRSIASSAPLHGVVMLRVMCTAAARLWQGSCAHPVLKWQHTLAAVLWPGDAAIMALANGVLGWHRNSAFSGRDGAPLTMAEGGYSRWVGVSFRHSFRGLQADRWLGHVEAEGAFRFICCAHQCAAVGQRAPKGCCRGSQAARGPPQPVCAQVSRSCTCRSKGWRWTGSRHDIRAGWLPARWRHQVY